jgi:nascent polypeptide-associated complex subunit alpha
MFGGGGGGMNPRKMQQMMEQMGIDVDDIDATEVVIRTPDGEELYFDGPEVTRMDARGQQTYQIVGEPTTRESTAGEGGEAPAVGSGSGADSDSNSESESTSTSEADAGTGGSAVEEQDVQIVVQRTGASESAARDALDATDGDLAAAIERLE